MRQRNYIIDYQNKKLSGNSNATVRGNAVIFYLNTSNNYTAVKEEEKEDEKRAIISVSIIIAFLFLYTMVVMVSNYN